MDEDNEACGYYRQTLFIILLLALTLSSCSRHTRTSKKQRQVENLQKERKKEAEELYKEAVKRHKEIQTRETRKRMRQSARESKRVREGRSEPFYRRWFRRKPGKAPRPTQ